MSIDALPIPVVTSSRRSGSEASRLAVNGVRSRIATTTSKPASRSRTTPSSSMWSWKTVTSASGASASHGASSAAHLLVVVEHGHLDRHRRSLCLPAPHDSGAPPAARGDEGLAKAPERCQLGLERGQHQLVGHRRHALVERSACAPGPPPGSEAVHDSGERRRRRSRRAARAISSAVGAGMPRTSGVGTASSSCR